MDIKIKIVDSHRKRTAAEQAQLSDFFCEVKELLPEDADRQTEFCDWFQREYAVSWFECIAFRGTKIIGYLRCLRNPESCTTWLIGDVHVREEYKKQGVASMLYEHAIAEVKEYEAAEYLVASVHSENAASIGLHNKFGFRDTGKPCDFPNFFFAEQESMYKLPLFQYYRVQNFAQAELLLKPLWEEYNKKEAGMLAPIGEVMKDAQVFESIWLGNRPVGVRYQTASGEQSEFITRQEKY